ncbi:MAG: DUF3887 domain-containing protein [Cyanobacteria bacterium CRU_2_1]|nr:DUF3887 domain-containing protein [Cyanobacteria bacterium CRU_2_1]
MKKLIPALLLPAVLVVSTLPAYAQSHQETDSFPLPQQIAQAEDVTTIAQDFISLLAGGQFNDALRWYDSTAATTISSDTLQASWNDIVAANGAFQRQISTQAIPSDGSGQSTVIVTCEFEQGSRDLFITFTGNQIVSFSIAQS